MARKTAQGTAARMRSAEALFICCALIVAGMICYAAAFRNGSENAPAIASTFGHPDVRHAGARHELASSRRVATQLTMQTAAMDSPPRPGRPTGQQGVRRPATRIGPFQRAGLISRGTPRLDLRPAGAVGDQPPKASPTATRTPSPTATPTDTATNTPTATATPSPVPPTDTPAPAASGTTATVWITGYTLGGTTATGGQAGPGVCAVDPSYIPLGTQISIDGLGSCVAEDTGPGVVGAHIDVWVSSYDTALGITGWYTAHW